MIRVIRLVRHSAVKSRTMTGNQLFALVTTAPAQLREQLQDLTLARLVAAAARFRPGDKPDCVLAVTKYALRELAHRYQQLSEQIDRLDDQLERLVTVTAPDLVEKVGVGTHTAATLLIAAGDNPERLDDEGSFAHLTGTAPLDASSGRQQRHRLNRGGDRDANCALHRIAITRLRFDERTKAYVKRRISEGKTKREALRCLKRYIAREVYKSLTRNPVLSSTENSTGN